VDFEQAESYVGSLLKFGINSGLGPVEHYLSRSGFSWEGMRFIHVGGTNGKGSTAAMIAGILHRSGYRVGLYSSPHIDSYRERIAVNSCPISREDFAETVGRVASAVSGFGEEQRLTEFEFLTVAALEYFRCSGVQVAVLEVGMGGRFDATNVIPCAEVSVITNVSRDHMGYLGFDTMSIAREKAGIIKPGGCLVTAEPSPDIRQMLANKCEEVDCVFRYSGEDVECLPGEIIKSKDGIKQKCSLSSGFFRLENLFLSMVGFHQIINAGTALLVCQVLKEKGHEISSQSIRDGLENTVVPGRFEVLASHPLVVLDAAHNRAGISALKHTISTFPGELVLVTGMLDEKEQNAAARIWGTLPTAVIVTRPDSDRSKGWRQLAGYFRSRIPKVWEIENIEEAVSFGWQLVGEDGILCVAGSFRILGRARQEIERQKDEP